MRLVSLLFAGLVVAIAPPAAGAPSPPVELDGMMDRLIHPDSSIRNAGLAEITRLGHPAALPGLIDVLYLDIILDSRVANLLERLSGQRFGHDWRQWVEWLQKQEAVVPHRDYAGWKGRLFSLIDPAFGRFFSPGVRHRVRLEEIVWGGVRKDGIPALTNPRHVRPDQATYLTADELVLGISVAGQHRAYPLRIMDWHEMANDVVGRVPISIAY
jgi:Protein of unknown function (DUF3179)